MSDEDPSPAFGLFGGGGVGEYGDAAGARASGEE